MCCRARRYHQQNYSKHTDGPISNALRRLVSFNTGRFTIATSTAQQGRNQLMRASRYIVMLQTSIPACTNPL